MHGDSVLNLCLATCSVACLLGCPSPEPGPCEDDALGCEESGTLAMDPSCELTGELEVHVGWGLDGYSTFDTRAQIWDGFQGGQHTFLAIRIPNAALDRYDEVEVLFEMSSVDPDCVENWDEVILSAELIAECSTEPPESRRVLFGERAPIRTDVDGAMQEYGIFLEVHSTEWTLVSASALDPCGRTGSSVSFFPGGS